MVANLTASGSRALEGVVRYVTEPAGQIWLRALIMIVVPLVFATLSVGIADLGGARKLGRMGLETLLFFVLTAALAGILGVALVEAFRPGSGLPAQARARLLETYQSEAAGTRGATASAPFGMHMLIEIVPRNPLAAAAQGDMLGVIFFSLVFGVALGLVPAARARPLLEAVRGLAEVMMVIIDLVMKFAPYGVFALIFSAAARFGFDLLAKLAWYVLVVIGGLMILQFGAYALLLRGLAGRRSGEFFRQARVVMLTAFSTSSSNATLPTTIRVSETSMGLPPEICGFVLPLGAAMNKNGSALFESATIVFIAQVLGIPLGLPALGAVVVMTVLTAGVGNAGVPSAIIPLMIPVLEAVGVPGEGIALIIGVDRLLDMFRTTVNVTGNMVAAAIVTRREASRAGSLA